MAISNWSTRRVLWLWVGVLAGYAVFMTLGAARIQRERRAFEQAWGTHPALTDTAGTRLSAPQLAQRDSLVDSLKRLAQVYLDSPEGKALAGNMSAALADGLPGPGELVLVGAVFLAPAVITLVLTIIWVRGRRVGFRPAGA